MILIKSTLSYGLSKFLAPSLIYLNSSDNNFEKELTRKIISTNNMNFLTTLVHKNQGKMNMFHITALLKKISKNKNSLSPNLLESVYKQVRQLLKQFDKPNVTNSRTIANVIGYTGNLGYHGIDDLIKNIDLFALIKYLNEKQIVQAITGALRLQLLDNFDQQQLYSMIQKNINKIQNFGLLVSLWRNFLKQNKSSLQINTLLCSHAIKLYKSNYNLVPIQNVQDSAYLIFCYLQSSTNLPPQILSQLLTTIKSCILNIVTHCRLKNLQFCLLVNNMSKLKKMHGVSFKDDEIIQSITMHYLRILQNQDIGLRFIDNGYIDYCILTDKDSLSVFNSTAEKLINILKVIEKKEMKGEENEEAFASLFLHMIEVRSTITSNDRNCLEQQIKKSQRLIQSFCLLSLQLVFENKKINIKKFTDKQLSKFLSGLVSYSKQYKNLPELLKQSWKSDIIDSISGLNTITLMNLNYIVNFCHHFQVKGERVCKALQKLEEKANKIRKQKSCPIGNISDCQNCFLK